jgi:antitoxin component of RelBE/YafQ-DinJ toxin-antitoxin module
LLRVLYKSVHTISIRSKHITSAFGPMILQAKHMFLNKIAEKKSVPFGSVF